MTDDEQKAMDAAKARAARMFPEEQRERIAKAFEGYNGPEYSGLYFVAQPRKDAE